MSRLGLVLLLAGWLCVHPGHAWLWKKPQAVVEQPGESQESEFIGWKGESYKGEDEFVSGDGGAPATQGDLWVETLSWEPRAFLIHNFITKKEADHLISLARDRLERSGVVNSDTGEIFTSSERTSSGVFLHREQDAVVAAIEARLAEATHLPLQNGEPLHILRYQDGEEYRPHFDYFHDDVHTKNGGQRLATLLTYLSDVEQGGETVFPDSVYEHPEDVKHHYSSCAQAGLAVKPRTGDALLFYSLHPNGTKDERSLHAGCPVIKGEKWSATKWIRVGHHAT